MIERYKKYLKYLDTKLAEMFKSQAPFIKCKKGCSLCCEQGEYPMSELEYIYIMFLYDKLNEKTKNLVNDNIINLINRHSNEKLYKCPFLISGECSVYEARAIICRTFGLISYDKNGNKKIPFCVDENLNYSNVFDYNKSKITRNAPDGTEPEAFNISREFLRNNKFESQYNIFFGDDKTLLDWLKEDFT